MKNSLNFVQRKIYYMENMKKYNVIYADPPWSFYNDSSCSPDCTTVKGVRRPPYNVLSSADIMALPVKDIADDNCVLLIWSTDYHLEKCMKVIEAWGFTYKSIGFVWSKRNKDGSPVCFTGAYTMKSGCELCLLATKGKDVRKKLLKSHNVRAYVESPRQEHSKKPNEIRVRIEQLFGDVPKIELFARMKNAGWDSWGNEVSNDIELNNKE